VVRQGASFGVRWAPTFKLVFTMRFINEDREYTGDPGALVLGTQREDTLRTWRFGAGWEPLRHLQLGVGLNVVDRTSNVPANEYDYQQVMLNARWTF
jgi:hypothetical protein